MNGNVTERNGQHHMRCDTLDNSNYAFLSSGKPNAIYWPTDEVYTMMLHGYYIPEQDDEIMIDTENSLSFK